MRVRLEVFGEAAFDRELMRWTERVVDATPAFEAMSVLFWQTEAAQFDSEGMFSGGWAPLAPSTVDEKARKFWDPRILHRTFTLAASLSSGSAPGSVHEITPESLRIGSDVPYGRYHQTGTERMPMRKPVELPEAVKVEMVKILQRWIVMGV